MTANDKIDQVIKSLIHACTWLESLKTETKEPEVKAPKINRFKRLLTKESWPKAVPDSIILNRDSDRERSRWASMVLDQTIERDIAGKKFLDLACGMGDLPHAALGYDPELSLGYDTTSGGWSRFPSDPRLIYTTDSQIVWSKAPYDAIFLHNVLDGFEDPMSKLENAADLIADDGLIYIRVCPWSSRYGMGDVRRLNKAFAHLYLEDHELIAFGLKQSSNRVIRHETYHEWFDMVGLRVRKSTMTKHPVETVFQTSMMSPRLMDLFGVTEFPEDLLQISHIDYTLEVSP